MLKLTIANNTWRDDNTHPQAVLLLPATDKQLEKATKQLGLDEPLPPGNFTVIDFESTEFSYLKCFMSVSNLNIDEANLLTHKLNQFDEQQKKDFAALIEERYGWTMKRLINCAYDLDAGHYKILRDVDDTQKLGEHFTNEQSPDLDELIFQNIDFEQVGEDVKNFEDGEFTAVGYVRNYSDEFEQTYAEDNLHKLLAEKRIADKHIDYPNLRVVKFFSPLKITTFDPDPNYDEDCELYEPREIDSETATFYKDEILTALECAKLPEESERGLMAWYHDEDSVNNKVISLTPTVEEWDDGLWGVAVCEIDGELTQCEINKLCTYWTGQASDGHGEGFEQRPIKTDDGEIYVSFWSSDRDWSICSEQDLKSPQNQELEMEM